MNKFEIQNTYKNLIILINNYQEVSKYIQNDTKINTTPS